MNQIDIQQAMMQTYKSHNPRLHRNLYIYSSLAAEPRPFMVLFFFFFRGTYGYRFHPIKNWQSCDQDLVAPFNTKFHNKTLCESGVMWIFRFVTYLSIVFHIYLCIIIHYQPSIITNVSILTDAAYFVSPSCHCSILALRSRDF